MLPHVLTPSQVIIYLYDSYQLSNELGLPPLLWNNQMCRSVSSQASTEQRSEIRIKTLSVGVHGKKGSYFIIGLKVCKECLSYVVW